MKRAVAWIFLALGGCFFSELTLIAPDPGSGGAGGTGGEDPSGSCAELLVPPYWSDACTACIQAEPECCALAASCLADEPCVAFRDCVEEDGPQRFRYCGHVLPYGADRWIPLSNCAIEHCRESCFEERKWRCVDGYGWPPPVAETALATLYVRVLPENIKPDLVAAACDGFTADCDPPLSEAISDPGTGTVYLDIDPTFRGYFEATGDGIFPSRIYPWPMWQGFLVNPIAPSIDTFSALADSLGDPLDPEMGRLMISTYDCNGWSAANVSFALNGNQIVEPPQVYYLQNLVPLVGQTATTSDGLAVWANVPPGAVTYSGTDQETGEVVTVGTVQVTAGWQTFVWAYPKAVR